jgi:2-C-methyl-D-erythritol 4-phosphate cytidylyltransferase
MKVIVIIPAAGLGTRMATSGEAKNEQVPSKQFTDLEGKPILIHTLRRFTASREISEIWVALRKSEIAAFKTRLQREAIDHPAIHLVEGGDHRQQTVSKTLSAIAAAADDIVLVHDAVRPFVTQKIIDDVIRAVEKHGAAIAAVPAVDTIKQVDRTPEGGIITATLPRERMVMAQTPQGFRYHVLKKAFDEANADGFLGTDEASLVERSGHDVAVVMGSPRNMKITNPSDMELARFYLQTENRSGATFHKAKSGTNS